MFAQLMNTNALVYRPQPLTPNSQATWLLANPGFTNFLLPQALSEFQLVNQDARMTMTCIILQRTANYYYGIY